MIHAADLKTLTPFRTKAETAEQRPNVAAFPILSVEAAAAREFLELTQGIARGDETAARHFFERYCDRLHRYLVVVTRGDDALSRDLLSISMTKAMRAMRSMASDEDIWRWLTRIAWTAFVDHCRKNQRRILTTGGDALEQTHAAASSGADALLTEALTEAMAELAPDERQIVEQYYFEETSQADLATEMHSTRKAIESRLARIRQKLRAAILTKIQ